MVVLQLPYYTTGTAQMAAGESLSGLPLVSLILSAVYGLATFLPTLAVNIRRLHDTGRSGWWYLIAFVPLVGGIVLLIFAVMDSQPGTNKWGPNPKGVGSAAGNAAW
ncbi:hypothetical protein DAETH_21420 [Deinococcus aetherius]|uniref:DUF805 domain-containing protein n=1 Tax=Deinococcus aetherius TaxID=200252 RepID=A0ABM8AET5_9DEIO|nr:DUF805 domain-containing protein [Deinococcus aetherius]BDP42173.1 hypothetical protein DAETH_21420 [Deinococcus aetherius]